jgi:hypothetical protein
MFMIFLGVRQYQIPRLKLSTITRQGGALTIGVSQETKIQIEGPIMTTLRAYLDKRHSNNDVIFLEPESNRPVRTSSISALLQELTYALRIECTPVALFHTYQHFMLYPEVLQRVLDSVVSNCPT